MNDLLRKTSTLLQVYYAYMVEYRAELIFWVLSSSLPIILMGVWNQAASEGNFGLTPLQFTRYFIAVFFVRQFTIVWVIWDFEREVVEGLLSPKLLQPIDPVWHHLAGHIGERAARLPFCFMLIGLFFLIYPKAFWLPSPAQIGLTCLAVTCSFFMRFLIQYTFAMLAFWTERASALEDVWFLLYLFLSGLIAPYEVFPPLIRSIALWTPFPYMINFPASLLVGLPVDVLRGLGVIAAWFFVAWIANRWLWKQGLKQYSGMGA